MNPIGIFPPPTRALSRQNTKSNASGSNSSSTSGLSRFHSLHADAQDKDGAGSGAPSNANHGRNKSYGSGAALASGSGIWTPFTTTESVNTTAGSASGAPGGNNTAKEANLGTGPSSGSLASSVRNAPRKLLKKRQPSSTATPIVTSGLNSATSPSQSNLSSSASSNTSVSPINLSSTSGSPAAFISDAFLRSEHPHSGNAAAASSSTLSVSPGSAPASKRKPTPDIPAGLPQTIFFDRLRITEVTAAHRLEVQGYPEEDAATLEKLRYRQAAAPHLFLGAFLPGAPKGSKADNTKDSHAGSTSSGNAAGRSGGGGASPNAQPPRTLIGFITGTAAPALTLRSMSTHSNSKDARLVCIHSVVVTPEYQHKGLALRLLREYIGRLMRNEMGPRQARLAALAEAKANAEAAATLAPPSTATGAGSAAPAAPVAFEDDDLLGDEDDEAEAENERSGDRQSRKRGYESLALLAHDELKPLYLKAGFRVQGLSHVNYGSGDWYEMRRDIVPRSALRKEAIDSDEDEDDSDEEDEAAASTPGPKSPEPKEDTPSALTVNTLAASLSVADSGSASTSDTPTPKPTLPVERQPSSGAASSETGRGDAQSNGHAQVGSDDNAGGIAASPPTLSLPPTLDPAALLAALTGGSAAKAHQGTASKSAQVSSPPQGPRNPGVPFSSVLGQALAGKTASEDPRSTLEARLVNREEDTNIADLYCPREACDCLLLRAELGVWKARELGPLSAPALQSSSASLPANTPAPPMNGVSPLPPRPSAEDHSIPLIFATGAAQQAQPKVLMQGATSLRDFWMVPSPFVFDNIAFSKDVQWPPHVQSPPASGLIQKKSGFSAGGGPKSPLGRGRSNSGSVDGASPGGGAATGSQGPTSPGGLRERSHSTSALAALDVGQNQGDDGSTPSEEKQRELFAQGVGASAPVSGIDPVTASDVGSGPTSASASAPLLNPPKDKSSGGPGPKIGGLKLTIGKRKTTTAVPTLGSAIQPDLAEPGTASFAVGPNSALLSPGAIPSSAASPGSSSWAASVATSGKKGLVAALGRGGRKDKQQEKDGGLGSAGAGGSAPSGTASGTASSSNTGTGASSPGAGGSGSGGGGSTLAGSSVATGSNKGGGTTPSHFVPSGRRAIPHGIDPHAYPFNTFSAGSSGAWHLPGSAQQADSSSNEGGSNTPTGPRLTIKYLLCGECDCGPLGYVVISDDLKAGGLARSVAAAQGGRDEGGGGGAPKKKIEYLLAAERVRYRFRASG
ncbi:hypothetical protein V8E36_001197 [Tilletia maclaganii]